MWHSNRLSFRPLPILAAALLLGACGEHAPTEPAEVQANRMGAPPAGSALVLCPTSRAYTASETIGPEGGTVTVAGHSVTLPAGAVAEPTEIELTAPKSLYAEVVLRADGREHRQFREPVSITIDYSQCPGRLNGSDALAVWEIDPATGALIEALDGIDDRERGRIHAQTRHFSSFAIAN